MQIIQILLNFGIAFGVDLFYRCEVTTTGQINQKGNYQFYFNRNGDATNHPQQLYTTYQIQIDFPWTINSDYICYDELLSPTPCTYSTGTRTIIANYFKNNYLDADYNNSTGIEFFINLDSVMNPSYSGSYDSPIQISIMSSTGTILEQCPNNGVYSSVLPGTGTCSGDGQQSKVSSTNTNLALTILLANKLAVESYLMVQYTQNWQNDIITKEIIPGAITCKIYANDIQISDTYCTKETNFLIKSTLGTGYDKAKYITIVISGINSPSSTKPVGSFILKTYNSNNKQIDECSISEVGGWTSNVVILSSLTWSNIVNQQKQLSFTFQLNSQIAIGDTLVITLPKEIQTSTTILNKISDNKSNFFNSQIIYPTFTLSNNVVTITSTKNFNSALYSVTLIFYNVIAPPSIKPTSSITMSTYRDNYIIDQSTSSLTISALQGTLTSITINAKNKVINQLSDYDISIQITNPLLTDGYIVIIFPTQFDLTQASSITNYKINSQSYTGSLSKSGQNLIISSLFSSTIVAQSLISFTVQQIKNQFSANISNAFSVQTYYSKSTEDYLVDQLTNYKMESFISGSIDTNSIVIKAENYFTGTQDNYEITFINTNTITANGYILIQIISDITISGNSQSCLINNIISTCTQINTQTIKIITANSLQASSSIKIQIKQFLINCSTLKILSNVITLKTYDDQGLLIDSGTGGTITMLYLSKFSLTLQNRSSNKNGEKSTYTFKINFQTNQINGIYVLITFPNELQFDLISCTSQSPLNTNLPCSITGLVFQIQLNCNTCTLIQMNTDYIFTINSIYNYISFKPISITQAYSIQILNDDTSKQSTLKDIITISNSVINSIKSFIQNYEIGYLQQLDNYSLSISLTNSFINQFKINIIIPSDIKVQQSTDTIPSTITNIIGLPNDINIQFNQQNIIITGNTLTSINQFQLKINNLMNPSTTTISGYLQINTYQISNNQDYSMDTGQLGTYIHKCTLPCKDCDSTILNKCNSCYDTQRKSLVNQQIYFMEIQNTCLSDCYSVQGYYVAINEYVCQKCNDECKTCKDTKSYCLTCNGQYKFLNNQCLTDCPITYYNDQYICKKCIDNCDTCQNNTICQKCSLNYYLYQQQCIDQCPQNITITNTNQQTCDICTNNCQTCQNVTSYCLSCKSNYYLYKNQCSNSCKDGTYINDTQCIDCQQKCKTCSNGTSCNSCQQNLLFFQNDCIDKCLDQYYSIDGKCQQCNVSCYTCEITQYKCTSCVNNTFLYNNQCLGQCPDEYYNDLNTNKCQKCISPCKTCKSNILCLSCITQTPILYYYNNSCNLNCLENYAPENGQCIQCRNPCKQCTLTPDTCSECYPNTYLYNQICVTDCGDGYYQDSQYYVCRQCSTLCKTCKIKNTNCLSCNIGQNLFKSNCVDDCGNGYYSQDQICYECLNKCQTCQNNISCTKCKDNLISYNNDCLTQCPTDLFIEDNTCVSCRSPCLSCSTSPDTCLACISSTYLDSNQKCVTDCGDGYFGDEISNKCLQCKSPCKTCTSNTSCLSCISQIPIFYFYNNSCNTQCQSGYAPENDTCIQCRSPCQTCDPTPDICLTCVPFTFLSSKKCVTECDDGYFGDSATDSCEKCISPCLTCTSLSKCNSCIKEAANNIYFEGECISACKNGYYEQNGTCIQCTEASTNSACISTVELIESIQSERFIPMPCTILTLVFIVTVIVAKIHRTETFIPGAISAFGGLFEWGSHAVLFYLSYLEWDLFNYQNFVIMGALGINYLLNFVHLILAKCIFHKDISFQQWLASRAVNKFTYCIITFLGFITTFKINKIVFSRYFGFYFFKARIMDVKELVSFNVISVISIIFTELPMVVAGVMILNFHDTKDQLYVSAIDCIIVSFLILIALIWEAQKEDEYFQENGFQALNQSVQQAYLIDQSNVQPLQQQVEEVQNQSQSIQQVVEATNIQSTNNQKRKLLSQNKSDVIFAHKKSSVVPEDDPFFKTQNNDSQSSAKKQKFEEFLKQRTVVPKNLDDQSLNLSSISQDENFNHPFNETSQDKDLLQEYQMLQCQNPQDKITKQVINDSQSDSNFSSELDFNNPPTNQQNTPQNKSNLANKFKKKTKTVEITTVGEDINEKILQTTEQELKQKKEEEERFNQLKKEEEERLIQQKKEEEERLIQQKIEEEKQRIQREEEQKLEQFKKEQQQKEEMYQQQLRQIQMEKEKIEEQKRIEELERIQQIETQRLEKEKILEKEKLLKSQIDEQLRQRKLQEQRELELQKLLDKEKEQKMLFQQQLIAKLQREEELKRQEEERKQKEREELEKLEQIKLELKKKEEQQLLELKLKEEKIQKEKEAEIERLKQELLLQQEQIKIQKQLEEERQRQEQIIKEQKEKEEQERIKQQKEELENQRKIFEQEERKQRELQIALEQQRQKELEQAIESQRIQELKFQELLREKEEIEKKAQEALQNQLKIDNDEFEIMHDSNFNQAPQTPEKQINSSFDEIVVDENQIQNDIMIIEEQNEQENLEDQTNQENQKNEFQLISFEEENDEVNLQKEKKKMFLQIQISDEEQCGKRKKQEHSIQDIEEQYNIDDINSRNQVTDYSKQIEFNDPQDQFHQKISSKSITVSRTNQIPQKINKTIQDYSRNKLEQSSQFQFQPKRTSLPNQSNQGTQQSKLLTSQSRAQGSIIGQQPSKFQSGITPNNKSTTHYNFQGTAYNSFAPKTTINKEKDEKYLRQKEEIYLQHIPNYYEKQVQDEIKKKKQQQQRKNLKSSQHNKFDINDDLHLEF